MLRIRNVGRVRLQEFHLENVIKAELGSSHFSKRVNLRNRYAKKSFCSVISSLTVAILYLNVVH